MAAHRYITVHHTRSTGLRLINTSQCITHVAQGCGSSIHHSASHTQHRVAGHRYITVHHTRSTGMAAHRYITVHHTRSTGMAAHRYITVHHTRSTGLRLINTSQCITHVAQGCGSSIHHSASHTQHRYGGSSIHHSASHTQHRYGGSSIHHSASHM